MVIGTDLKNSLLLMFNQMKDELMNPDKLEMANITMIHNKNSKLDFNWRGIYVTSVLWKVIMKMIYERTYKKVASSMTVSQIRAQKKSVRNHIFVIISIICDVLSSVKNPPIDISVIDYRQMFDSKSLQVCLTALY